MTLSDNRIINQFTARPKMYSLSEQHLLCENVSVLPSVTRAWNLFETPLGKSAALCLLQYRGKLKEKPGLDNIVIALFYYYTNILRLVCL